MGKAFDIGLERLTGRSVPGVAGAQDLEIVRAGGAAVPAPYEKSAGMKASATAEPEKERGTFYLETFGCQMNEHDSEKVAGVLLARGYKQVERLDAADVILYNTCSIREKAAQKVFSRLGELRPVDWTRPGCARIQPDREAIPQGLERAAGRLKDRPIIGVLGCLAQQ